MKKYKLKKDIIGAKAGMIFEYGFKDGIAICSSLGPTLGEVGGLIDAFGIENEEYFEEIKKKPKFKVGDYVVYEPKACLLNRYVKISDLYFSETHEDFFVTIDGEGISESELRKPTEEELKLYFR